MSANPNVQSVTAFGALGDGVTDSAPAFQAAIDALWSKGGTIRIPPGTFVLRSTIRLTSGTVLRGSGAEHTHLIFDLDGRPDNAIEIATFDRGEWVSVIGGANQGSTRIEVSNSFFFDAPIYAELEQTNDPDLLYTRPEWDQFWALQAVGQVVRVVGKVGDALIIDRPLRYTYDQEMEPRIRPLVVIESVGIEDLHIKRLDDGEGGIIQIKNAAKVWVRGVESEMASRFHVNAEVVYQCEIRESYFHHAHDYGIGGFGYGVTLQFHTTGCLVENNIFENLRHSILLQLGSNDNVVAYNYSREPSSGGGHTQNDISLHGHYPHHNLFEGNVVQKVGVGDFWGPAGPGNVFFRNCVESLGIRLFDHSHLQKIIGNVLPVVPNNTIWVDVSVQNSFVHGNSVNGEIQWDPQNSDRTIEDSLYLGARPFFFGEEAWPSIGSDRGADCANPAKVRWSQGRATPLATTVTIRKPGHGVRRVEPEK